MALSISTVTEPYLPDLMSQVVARIDSKFFSRLIDPFHVYFAHGNYAQANRYVHDHPDVFPLVYLVMPFSERRGNDESVFADITCRIAIAMTTEGDSTQEERDTLTIKPRLIPVYEELLKQIHADKNFSTQSVQAIKHDRVIRPFDGLGDVNGPAEHNMFKQKVDWLDIPGLQLKLRFT